MGKFEYAKLNAAEEADIKTEPALKMVDQLLKKEIEIETPEGETLRLQIEEVEAFSGLDMPSMKNDFDSMQRKKGEIFITHHRGAPAINIVVNSKKRSVVCILSASLEGKELNFTQIANLMGLDAQLKGKELFHQVQKALDGKETGPSDALSLEKSEDPDRKILDTIKATNTRVNKSMGVYALG